MLDFIRSFVFGQNINIWYYDFLFCKSFVIVFVITFSNFSLRWAANPSRRGAPQGEHGSPGACDNARRAVRGAPFGGPLSPRPSQEEGQLPPPQGGPGRHAQPRQQDVSEVRLLDRELTDLVPIKTLY